MKRYQLFKINREYNAFILGTQYIVEEGDSLYNIAQRFNTDVKTLKKINNLQNDIISPGQLIMVDDIYTPGKQELYTRYVVQSQDTLYKIAFLFNMTYQELKDLNDLITDDLRPGQVLLVHNVENVSNDDIYTVVKGDSIYSIARENNTTVDAIKRLNNLESNKINVGDKLIVNGDIEEEIDDDSELYIVLPNDNLYSIANKKNTTVKKIKEANNLTSDLIQVGQELIIPQ